MKGPLLVILPHNPGDVVMGLAAVRRIKSAYPDLAVDYVVGEECRDLAEGHPLLRRVHVIPRKAMLAPWKAGDADGALKALESFIASLREEEYAVSLNLFQEKWGALLHGFARSRRKVGLALEEDSHYRVGSRFLEHLFAVPAARAQNGWHAVDAYVRAAREALGLSSTDAWPAPSSATPWLPPLPTPSAWNGPAPKTYFAFHPGSAWRGKRWPESHWASLASDCLEAGIPVVFTGAPEERPVVDAVLAGVAASGRRVPTSQPVVAAATAVTEGASGDTGGRPRDIHDWAGRTTLAEAAWIHGNARMTVTGDTAAMHLAAAAGTPTIALFGPSNPVETGPYGPGHFVFQTQLDLPSTLAFDAPHAGLAALSPEAVAGLLLQGRAPAESSFRLWETAWDGAGDRQVLRDARGSLHPHQQGSAALMNALDRGGADDFPARPLPGAREAVRRALDLCAARGEAGDFRGLEQAERALGAETADEVIWEAYRIAVNGLPLRDLRLHIDLRRARFARAVGEEQASSSRAIPR